MQLFGLAHETLFNVPGGFGPGTIDHRDPFQCCTKGRPSTTRRVKPTAKQLVVLGHVTAFKLASGEVGLGMIAHCAPFQCSTSVFVVPAFEK
jgi:hypothetical protein